MAKETGIPVSCYFWMEKEVKEYAAKWRSERRAGKKGWQHQRQWRPGTANTGQSPDADFLLCNGNRTQIKRKLFEKYIDEATVV